MKITHLETVPYRIPMRKPLNFASGEVHHIEHVLVRLTTDEGLVGTADIPPRPYTYGETVESVIAVINTIFAEALIGADPLDRAALHAKLHRTIGNQTAKGGVDIALWDLIGQTYSTPVHRLLGGFSSSLEVSHMLGFSPTQAVVDEALSFTETYGVHSFKLKSTAVLSPSTSNSSPHCVRRWAPTPSSTSTRTEDGPPPRRLKCSRALLTWICGSSKNPMMPPRCSPAVGEAVLRAAGHATPVNASAVVSGFMSVLNACFGAVSACLTGPTNALLTSSGDPKRQYSAAVFYSFLCFIAALFSPLVTRFMLGTPEAYILALGGMAMLGALRQAFVSAFSSKYTFGALVTFVVTIAEFDLFNIHAAFWGILIGCVASRFLEPADYKRDDFMHREHAQSAAPR